MASPSSSSAPNFQNPNKKKTLGLFANALKRKDSFVQFFIMSGIFLLSLRSLGQKYRLHDLEEDAAYLKEEQKRLHDRMNHIKSSLLHEASLDSTGLFASRLRTLFADDQWIWWILYCLLCFYCFNLPVFVLTRKLENRTLGFFRFPQEYLGFKTKK